MSYKRFALMILASTLMMFGLMYLNTYTFEHVFFSETRVYMAILMGAAMAFIMLLFMWGMYPGKGLKVGILVASVLVFGVSLWLVRSQITVGGVNYMRAMIPHHSIAVMTSERAGITDPRTRKLADGIIEAQQREIAEMRFLIADIGTNGDTSVVYEDPAAQQGSVTDALTNTVRSELDPAQMTAEEIAKIAPAGVCTFRQTSSAPAIFVSGPDAAGMKLNGVLVALQATEDTIWSTEGVTLTVRQDVKPGFRANADLIFSLQDGPTVGYRGFWTCNS